MAVEEAVAGDIVVVSGIADISIGETICDPADPQPMEMIEIEQPTLSMNFMVNKSPFAGKVGKFVTSRHIKERLEIIFENNFGWNKIMKQRPQQIAENLPDDVLMFYHSHEDEDFSSKQRITIPSLSSRSFLHMSNASIIGSSVLSSQEFDLSIIR